MRATLLSLLTTLPAALDGAGPVLISGCGAVSAGGAVTMRVTTAVPLIAARLAQRRLVGAMTRGAADPGPRWRARLRPAPRDATLLREDRR